MSMGGFLVASSLNTGVDGTLNACPYVKWSAIVSSGIFDTEGAHAAMLA